MFLREALRVMSFKKKCSCLFLDKSSSVLTEPISRVTDPPRKEEGGCSMESSLSLTFSDIQHTSPGSLEPGPEWTSLPILFSKWLRRMYSWDRLYVLDKDLSLCPPPWPPNADLIVFSWKVGWVVKGSLEPDLPRGDFAVSPRRL